MEKSPKQEVSDKKRMAKVQEKEAAANNSSTESDYNKRPRLVGPPKKVVFDEQGNPIIRKRGRPPKNPVAHAAKKEQLTPQKPSK